MTTVLIFLMGIHPPRPTSTKIGTVTLAYFAACDFSLTLYLFPAYLEAMTNSVSLFLFFLDI